MVSMKLLAKLPVESPVSRLNLPMTDLVPTGFPQTAPIVEGAPRQCPPIGA